MHRDEIQRAVSLPFGSRGLGLSTNSEMILMVLQWVQVQGYSGADWWTTVVQSQLRCCYQHTL